MNILNVMMRRVRSVTLAGLAGLTPLLASCASTGSEPAASVNVPPQADHSAARNITSVSQSAPPKPDPYANVNTVARDRDVWQQLLSDHGSIRRVLRHSEKDGVGTVETLTESDDPKVAAHIIDHAKAMRERMKVGAVVRIWDPVFKELFENHARVTLDVTPTEKGVKVVESSSDPQTIALMRSHAIGVSAFVRSGHAIGGDATPRLNVTDPLPPDEVAIGGLPHRFLLSQPSAEQVKLLHSQGVNKFMNFRKHDEHKEYDEANVAASAGAAYCNLPYKEPGELTDELFRAARTEYTTAAKNGVILAPHCRTGNRVGPGLAAYLAIDLKVPVERAIGAAKAVGMVDARYEAITRDYIQRELK